MNQEVFTPQEIADLLKIKKTTVYEMIKRGDLTATKLGKQLRVSEEELNRYLTRTQKKEAPALVSLNTTFYANEDKPIVLCGQDSLLDILSNKINSNTFRPTILRSYLGSYNGLYAMYQGQVSLATVHLWDMETDTYNLPFISKLLPGVKVVVYHLIKRMQGFYVQKGNPKGITGFRDLSRNDLIYINREKGSGTRILLDSMLSKQSISPSLLNGYYNETTSHLAVATAVAKGNADFGLGTLKVSKEIEAIDFLPLKEESYDLVIRECDLAHPVIEQIITVIKSEEFKNEIQLLGNYNTQDIGLRIF